MKTSITTNNPLAVTPLYSSAASLKGTKYLRCKVLSIQFSSVRGENGMQKKMQSKRILVSNPTVNPL